MTEISENISTRFADYFVICGLDLESGLEPDKFAGDLNKSPLERTYKSKTLAHYPENVSHNPFDAHGTCMLSLPQGLKFSTQKNLSEPKFHAFATTREDGKRCYGFSLVFYEEVLNKSICSAMHTLQSMFITECSSVPVAPRQIQKVKDGPVSKSLPRHFKLATHPSSSNGYYEISKDTLYVTKAVVLVCQQLYAHTAELFLCNLYKCLPLQQSQCLSLESYVYNILYEIVIPHPGKSIRIYLPPSEPHLPPMVSMIQNPGTNNELPLLDFPLRLLFSYLDINSVIKLFTCVLLEYQVILRSTDYNRLFLIAECMTSLLFPFSWPHVYAPILPASLHHFLEAPVPFVMGLHADSEINVKIGSEASLCSVDIDKNIIQLPEELPMFPHYNEFIDELLATLHKFQVRYSSTSDPNGPLLPPETGMRYPKKGLSKKSSATLPSSGLFKRSQLSSVGGGCGSDSLHQHNDYSHVSYQPLNNSTQRSEMLQKIVDIVRRTGIAYNEIECSDIMPHQKKNLLNEHDQYCDDMRLNNSLREIFFNRFIQMFSSYESFVILPNQDQESWLINRETLQNFDKASFLSEQIQNHRPFLSRFLESQMFATLIDNKITASWKDADIDHNLNFFDNRIKMLKNRQSSENVIGNVRYELCTFALDTQTQLEKRLSDVEIEVSTPKEILANGPTVTMSKHFPILDAKVLNQPLSSRTESLHRIRNPNKWHFNHKTSAQSAHLLTRKKPSATDLSAIDISPALISQANWTFVEKLLKDCKSKTKRMLLEKMGTEAGELGLSASGTVGGIEENTLVSSLCDLLEKIWSHGLQKKQIKSPLWNHLQSYYERHKQMQSYKNSLCMTATGDDSTLDKSIEAFIVLPPLPDSLEFDIKNILLMTDIKTEIGCARAWVRLSLEKKLLSRHLRSLLSDTSLLRTLYKRNSFLLAEEEKDQFLYHLLTLTAVDYFCFTNIYPTLKLPYRIKIMPSRKTLNVVASIKLWISVSGNLCESQRITPPDGTLEFVFHHLNLGLMTTLRIGNRNYNSEKWFLEQIVARNEVTGLTYRFPCNRWLGRDVDDGSTERMLVGQIVSAHKSTDETVSQQQTNPSIPVPVNVELSSSDIQHMLGNCVNDIVKWHYKSKRCTRDRESVLLTNLLCNNEKGLVKCLEQVFLYGFRLTRYFVKNLYVWDYFERVKEEFERNAFDGSAMLQRNQLRQEYVHLSKSFCRLMDEVNGASQAMGKDGKFQIFICLSLRENILQRLLSPMADAQITQEMYEVNSFLRKKGLLTFLKQILEPLSEIKIPIETSVTQGI